MKVLLLHPEDRLGDPSTRGPWDLIIDLAHTPVSTRERWQREAGCSVISLYDFAQGTQDLYCMRQLLEEGLGQVVDHTGIDWWDVVSLMISPQLQDLMLVRRVAAHLKDGSDLFTSRPNSLANALQVLLRGKLVAFNSGRIHSGRRRLQHYSEILSQLDTTQLVQVAWDKFDSSNAIRRRLSPPPRRSRQPVVLLPSAYVNVSRTAVSYAAMLPEQQFLLVIARKTGALRELPANVGTIPLASYSVSANWQEVQSLLESWKRLHQVLIARSAEFKAAAAIEVLDGVPGLIHWGVAVRNAWKRVLELEDVVACMSTDDSNPYTRIPLILARQRQIPALACHHGAFDARMAFKQAHWDVYLAKSEMERDYLVQVCRVAPERVAIGGPESSMAGEFGQDGKSSPKELLVLFTEPYPSDWRGEEIYTDLVPRLAALARVCGLRLVLKVHPFESIKRYRLLIARCLAMAERERVEVIAGPLTTSSWEGIRFAVTGESSVAIECTCRGIPIFLCGWMRDPQLGYTQQYAKFGVGTVLNLPADLDRIPVLLSKITIPWEIREQLLKPIDKQTFRAMLAGKQPESVTASGSIATPRT
jgi:hypothetical protein